MRDFIKRTVATLLCLVLVFGTMNYSRGAQLTSAEKLNQLGLLLNINQSELDATLSRDIGLTMILKALGYTQEDATQYESSSPFSDTPGWSKGWVSLAYALDITKGTSDTTFTPSGVLSEREFLTFLLRALGYDKNESYTKTLELSKESGLISSSHSITTAEYTKADASEAMLNALSAVVIGENVPLANILITKGLFSLSQAEAVGIKNGSLELLRVSPKSKKEISVVFSAPVKTSDYIFDIEAEELDYRCIVLWSEDKTTAYLQMVSPLEEGEYTIITTEVSGERHKYTNEVVVESSLGKLDILSDSLGLIDGSYINYSYTDFYDMEIYELYKEAQVTAENLTQNSKHSIEMMDSLGAHRLRMPSFSSEGGKMGDIIKVTLSINGLTTSKELKVVIRGDYSSFELHNAVAASGTNRFSVNQKNIDIPYTAADKLGTALKLNMHSANSDQTNDVEIMDHLILTSSNPGVVDVDSLKVNNDGFLKVNIGSSPGATTLRAYNTVNKTTSVIQIVVYPESVLTSVVIMPQTKLISIGEEISLDAIGYDQFGAKVSIGYISGLDYTSSDEEVVKSSSAKLLNNLFVCKGIEEGDATLTISNKTGLKLGSITVDIVGEAEPQNITEMKMPKFFEASSNASYSIDYDDLVVKDQFAQEYDLSVNRERIFIEEEDNDLINLNLNTGNFTYSGLLVTGIDDEVGTSDYRVYIEDLDYSALFFSITSIDSEDIDNYRLTPMDNLKVDTNPTEESELKGYTKSGDEIVIDKDTITVVTSSEILVATAEFDGNVITVTGIDAGESTITVWRDTEKLATIDVTVIAADE